MYITMHWLVANFLGDLLIIREKYDVRKKNKKLAQISCVSFS